MVLFELRRFLYDINVPFFVKDSNSGNGLVTNFEEIINLLKEKNGQILKLFYFNRENVHTILYQANEIIYIDNNQLKKLCDLFYLDLLMNENENIVNYIFPKESIISLYDELKKVKNFPKKVILAKIVKDLIESYKGFGNEDEKINENSLANLSDFCIKEIKSDIKNNEIFFGNIDIDDILMIGIDKLYAEIIMKLFKPDFFSYDYALDILKDLELDDIDINENIYFLLNNYLIKEKINIIEKIEDLINITKINIYYLLLKYIFKNPFYLYQSDFFLKARQLLISIINNNLYTFLVLISDLEIETIEKLDFIIKTLTDTGYYFDKYMEFKKSEKINNIIKEKKIKYFFPLMQILLDLKINEINFSETEINTLIKKSELFYDIIKQGKFRKLPLRKRKELYSYLQDKNNKILLLKLFTKEQYESFQKLDINYVGKFLDDNYPIKNNENNNDSIQVNSESNIIINDLIVENIDELSQQSVIMENITSMIINSYTIQDIKELETEAQIETINFKYNQYDLSIFRKSNKFKLIEFIKTLEANEVFNNSYFHYTKNISKGHYLVAGNHRKIIIYNSYYERKLEIHLHSRPQNIYEMKDNNTYKEEIKLIACCFHKLILITINLQDYSYKTITKSQEANITYNSYYNIGDKCLINGIKGGFLFPENKMSYHINKIFKCYYLNGVSIKEKIFAFSSNNLLPHGDNQLIIYDFNTNKIMKQINAYSLRISNNGLYVMDMEKIKSINIDRQILFCSCALNKRNGKNGFLYVNINLEKKEFIDSFYDTKEFEPHCFCQVIIVDNNNSINDDITKEKNIEIKETEYFLVGGFDPMKRSGCVKLYKIKYDKRNDKISIKYLLDIENGDVETFKGFDMDVSCITQSKITGNLLITCLDGNVYLFKPINLELFLKN